MTETQGVGEREIHLFSPQMTTKARTDHAEDRNQGLLPTLPCGWQGPTPSGHPPLIYTGHHQGAELEGEQPGWGLGPIWNTDITGGGTTMQAFICIHLII